MAPITLLEQTFNFPDSFIEMSTNIAFLEMNELPDDIDEFTVVYLSDEAIGLIENTLLS
jgi:hypothetical protein